MELKEAFMLALQSLWANKLRTVLTLLGVVIGVASVIAVVTLVNGANRFVIDKFSSYGADVFTVTRTPTLITTPEEYVRLQKRKNLLFDDYKYIQDNCKRWRRDGWAAGGDGQAGAGHGFDYGCVDSRVYVADAVVAEPEHYGRPRSDGVR